jgi:hypothetical protein
MNLFSGFIIKALEAQFLSHLPELQKKFLDEVAEAVKAVSDWIESKMSDVQENKNDEKSGE